jgi:hypothetical protein
LMTALMVFRKSAKIRKCFQRSSSRNFFFNISGTMKLKTCKTISVPDKRSRILEVVIVRRLVTWVLGIWRGEGMGKGCERGGQFTSNLRQRWTDPVTTRRVSK